ncbi:hypothetical protein DPMN_125851 [Dreissena polymorpha]|uniref:Uncharacterized protein n=1 Tax=Dreissena polymorpha TaxID=45954 RepID=A0A9D4GYA0_DREPO|nr:hypothetical protein DPMN_125851 [Dreissena polymorpha]
MKNMMFSYKTNCNAIWEEVFRTYNPQQNHTADEDDESDDSELENNHVNDMFPDYGAHFSNTEVVKPTVITIDECSYSSDSNSPDEDVTRCKQTWSSLLNIQTGPYGVAKREREAVESVEDRTYVEENLPLEIELEFKFQYLIMTQCLKVTVTGIRNLTSTMHAKEAACAYVEACLMPGKLQKRRTNVATGFDDIKFEHVMFFRGGELDEMHHHNLRLIINAREQGSAWFRKLGEVYISLEDFDITTEIALHETINTRIFSSRSGHEVRRMKIVL